VQKQWPIIAVDNVTLAFDDYVVQKDVSFSVKQGEIFVIIGGSGCGKSTMMRSLIGLLKPASGEIYYDGEPLWSGDETQRTAIKQRFGVLFQSGALWSSLTLAENVALPLTLYTPLHPRDVAAVVSLKLSLVGLAGYEEFYPSAISGGMKKRAGLARAIALDPDILFFDEPSAGLDPISSKRLDDLILQLRDCIGATIVIVTHELASIFEIGDNVVFLDADTHTAIAHGSPQHLLDNCEYAKVREFLARGSGHRRSVRGPGGSP